MIRTVNGKVDLDQMLPVEEAAFWSLVFFNEDPTGWYLCQLEKEA